MKSLNGSMQWQFGSLRNSGCPGTRLAFVDWKRSELSAFCACGTRMGKPLAYRKIPPSDQPPVSARSALFSENAGSLVIERGHEGMRLIGTRDCLLIAAIEDVVGRDDRAVLVLDGRQCLRPGIRDREVEAMGVSLGQLHLERIVPAIAERSPQAGDVQELRIWSIACATVWLPGKPA